MLSTGDKKESRFQRRVGPCNITSISAGYKDFMNKMGYGRKRHFMLTNYE